MVLVGEQEEKSEEYKGKGIHNLVVLFLNI